MDIWQIWLAVGLAMAVLEIFTSGFAVLCFGIGAVGAAVVAAVTPDIRWQVGAFVLCSFIALLYVRPFFKKIFSHGKPAPKSGVEALIGRKVRVETDILPDRSGGRVAVDGDSWKAVSADDSAIRKGETVVICSVDSVVLTVERLQK